MSIPRNLSKLAEGADSSGVLGVTYGGTNANNAADARTNLGLGSAATEDITDFATAAQGTLADNALSALTSNDGSVVISTTGTSKDLSVGVAGSTGTLISQVRNETGATLTKGTVVYISGAASNKALVSKALASADATSAQTYGVVQADIPHNQNGYVVVTGVVSGLNTLEYPNGTQLYLSGTTAGGYTSTKPYAPTHLVYVGVVTYSHANQGTIQVKIQNGYEMDELHDVSAQSPSNGNTLVYNTNNSLWESTSTLSGSYTLSGGTANGVTYLNGSKVLTSGSALTFDGTNLGVGTSSPVANTPLTLQALSGYTDILWLKSVGTNIDSRINIAPTGTGIAQLNNTNGTPIAFQISGTEGFRLTSTSLYTASGINVAFGTSSPTSGAKLTVSGSIYTSANIFTSGNNTGVFFTGSTSDYTYGIGRETAGLALYSGNAARAIIDSTGNVSIGTSNPEVKLEVNGGSDGSVVFGGRSDGGNGNNRRFNLIAFADGGGAGYGGGLKIQTRDSVNVFADRITVKSDGNVGIGTNNPLYKLQVNGDTYINGNFIQGSLKSYPQQSISLSVGTSTWVKLFTISNPGNCRVKYNCGSQNSEEQGEFTIRGTYVSQYVQITWSRQTYYSNLTEIRVVGSNGQPYTVWGLMRTTDFVPSLNWQVIEANNVVVLHNTIGETPGTASASLNNPTWNGTSSTNDGSFYGNLGVGTTNPTAKLDVANGGLSVSGWSNNNSGSAGGLEIGWDGSQSVLQSYNRVGNAYTPLAYNASKHIFGAGYVGIGTANPSTNLTIGNGASGSGLGVYLSRGAVTNFFESYDGTKRFIGGVDPDNAYVKIGSLTNHPVGIVQNNSPAIYIDTGKNISIGTTSSDEKLTVAGNIRLYGNQAVIFQQLSGVAVGAISFRDSSAVQKAAIGSYYNVANEGAIEFIGPSSITNMILRSSGNLHIGATNDPGYKLGLTSDTTGDGILIDVLSNPTILLRDRGNSDTKIGTGSTAGLDNFYVSTYAVNHALMIKGSNGFVGIGTNDPGERLTVNGSIRSTTNAINFSGQTGAQFDYYNGEMRFATHNGTTTSIMYFNAGTGKLNVPGTVINNQGGGVGSTSPYYAAASISPTSTSSGVAIYDIHLPDYFAVADAQQLEIYVHSNPNGGGSGSYRQVKHITANCMMSWNGAAYTPLLEYDSVNDYMGMGFDCVIFFQPTGQEFANSVPSTATGSAHYFWTSTGVYLRVKVSGFNASYPGIQSLGLIVGHKS
jgi:hypothetical protein